MTQSYSYLKMYSKSCKFVIYLFGKHWASLGGSDSKESSYNGLGRSLGEGNGYPLQYSCLESPQDGGAWQATVHRAAKSLT